MLQRGRQLEHSGDLAFDQPGNLDNQAAREFKCIVMHLGILHIDLPKPSDLVMYARLSEKAQGAVVLDVNPQTLAPCQERGRRPPRVRRWRRTLG